MTVNIAPPGNSAASSFGMSLREDGDFFNWVAQQVIYDSIDHVLGCGDHPLVPFRYSKLALSRRSLRFAQITEGNFAEHLPFLLADGAAETPAMLLEAIGVTPPDRHVLDDLALGDGVRITPETTPLVKLLLRALRPNILKICFNARRALLTDLVNAGIRPNTRIALIDLDAEAAGQAAFEESVRPLMDLEVSGYYGWLEPSSRAALAGRQFKVWRP